MRDSSDRIGTLRRRRQYSTHAEFYEALQGRDIANGSLNRFLILSTEKRVPDTDTIIELGPVPKALAASLKDLFYWGGTAMGTSRSNDISVEATPDKRPWASQKAKDVYKEYAASIDARMAAEPELAPFLTRAAEMALLATIRAARRFFHLAEIDQLDIEWGRDVANESVTLLTRDAREHIVDGLNPSGQLQKQDSLFHPQKSWHPCTEPRRLSLAKKVDSIEEGF
jgi:hypothetical protein